MRDKNRLQKPPARPQATVKPLQIVRAAVMIQVRLTRSASQASGTPRVV